MTTEAQMWKKLRPILNEFGLANRIENAAATSIPDVLWFGPHGTHCPIELKLWANRSEVSFNRFQLGWWSQYHKATGVNGLICVSDKRDLAMTCYSSHALAHGVTRQMAGSRINVKLEDDFRIGMANNQAQWEEILFGK